MIKTRVETTSTAEPRMRKRPLNREGLAVGMVDISFLNILTTWLFAAVCRFGQKALPGQVQLMNHQLRRSPFIRAKFPSLSRLETFGTERIELSWTTCEPG